MLRRIFPNTRRPEQSPSEREPKSTGRASRWRPNGIIIATGGLTLLLGSVLVLEPWYEALQWRASPEAVRAQHNADAPTPIWITPAPAQAAPTGSRSEPRTGSQPAAATPPAAALRASTPPVAAAVADTPTPQPLNAVPATPTLQPSQLELLSSEFRFLDPPEPGAAARLTVSLGNPTDEPGGPITLALPLDWLAGYAIDATEPVTWNGAPRQGDRGQGELRLTFDGPAAQSDLTLGVQLTATAEVIDPPLVRVFDSQGRSIGSAQPPTEAPPPRAGPVWAITIPRLNLSSGVVQVDWEPPQFVVGQIRTSAHVTEGNSVLVGHVRGAAGYNVFDHLDQLAPGDVVVASSRGVTYQFVVDQTEVRPEDDTSPTDPTATPRLTLMTCAGDWNPITRDYPDRLWIIAEPADVAAAAIAARAASPLPDAASTAASRLALAQLSPRAGLGNTDVDLARALGSPRGESAAKLAVYPRQGQRPEQRAQLADMPSAPTRRAVLVAAIPPVGSPLTFDDAVHLSRGLVPDDTQPRAAKPEGNSRFAVERFTSPALAAVLPAEWFADRQGQPGDFLVVYARRPDGRVAAIAVGIGDDAQALLAALDDV